MCSSTDIWIDIHDDVHTIVGVISCVAPRFESTAQAEMALWTEWNFIGDLVSTSFSLLDGGMIYGGCL